MKKKHYIVVKPDGTTCGRCDQEAETRKHTEITAKQLAQPFYYLYWYKCNNKECRTTIFMLEDWKVMNKNSAAQNFQIIQESRDWEARFKSLF